MRGLWGSHGHDVHSVLGSLASEPVLFPLSYLFTNWTLAIQCFINWHVGLLPNDSDVSNWDTCAGSYISGLARKMDLNSLTPLPPVTGCELSSINPWSLALQWTDCEKMSLRCWALHHGRDGLRVEWQIALFHPFSHLVAWMLKICLVSVCLGGLVLFVVCVLLVSRSFQIWFSLYHSIRGLLTDHA